MTAILALDTSTEACSCALYVHGEFSNDYALIPRQHAQNILPMIQSLLNNAGIRVTDLDAIAFGRGPGSFTGLRIATGVAQGLALASDLPLIPVSTLAALAWKAHQELGSTEILACIDARIDEVYWAWYSIDKGIPVLQGAEMLSKPELMQPCPALTKTVSHPFTAVGNGLVYLERFPTTVSTTLRDKLPGLLPDAKSMVSLAVEEWQQGRSIKAELAHPVYLRDKVTQNQP